MKILTLGSIALDVLIENFPNTAITSEVTLSDGISLSGGGGALNTSIALKRLGIDSYLLGEVGLDYAGDVLLKIIDEESVNRKYVVQKKEKCSSVVAVLIDEHKERRFVCNPGNYVLTSFDEYNWKLLQNFNILFIASSLLLTKLLPDLHKLLKLSRDYGLTNIVDTVNPVDDGYKYLFPAFPFMDYFMPSINEAHFLSKKETPHEMAKFFLELGVKNVIIKMDKDGCYLLNEETEAALPALPVEPIDTTGAGDCFIAGFIKGLAENYDKVRACKLANCAGAASVQKVGAYTAITNFEELVSNL